MNQDSCNCGRPAPRPALPFSQMVGSYFVFYLPPDVYHSTWHYAYFPTDSRIKDMPDIREYIPEYIYNADTQIFTTINQDQIIIED